MKKILVLSAIVLCILGVVIAQLQPVVPFDKLAQQVDPGTLHTSHNVYVVIDATTSSGTEPSDLASDERTYQTVVAAIAAAANGDEEISVYGDSYTEKRILNSWNGVKFQAIGITNNGTCTWQIYFGHLGPYSSSADCNLTYAGQLAFTIGQQASTTSTYEMADTLTVTPGDWTSTWRSSSPGSDRVATGKIDLEGADLIVAVGTTASCDCKLLITGY